MEEGIVLTGKIKKINLMLVIMILILILSNGVWTWIYFSKKTSIQKDTPNLILAVPTLVPEILFSYLIYSAEYQGHQGIFISGDTNTAKIDFRTFNEGYYSGIESSSLTNIKDYYALPPGAYNARIVDMNFNDEFKTTYVSVLYYLDDSDGDPLPFNAIYRLSFAEDYLTNLDGKEVWKNDIKTGKKYGDNDGIAWINQVIDDKYLELNIAKCYECIINPNRIDLPTSNFLIVNSRSGKELYLGSIGISKFDIASGNVSYTKQTLIQVPCDANQTVDCDENRMMRVYSAAKEVSTSKLP